MVGLADLDLDFGLAGLVHDLQDFLGNDRSVDVGVLTGLHRRRRRGRFDGGFRGAVARGDADGEEEEGDDDEGADEDSDHHP